MKISSSLPVVESELPDQQELQTSIVPVVPTSSLPVNQSELDATTAASSLLVDKGELLTDPTPAEPTSASSQLVETSEPQEPTVEHDANDVQLEPISASSPQVDGSELLEAMRGSTTVGITTTEVIESDNSLPEPTSDSSPAIEQSELLAEVKSDVNPPVVQSELLSESTPTEPISASDTPVTQKKSKPRSKSISEPPRRRNRSARH